MRIRPLPLAPSLSPTSQGILLMLLAILAFTAMDAVAKGLVARYPTGQIIWTRFAGQFVLVLLILNRRVAPMLRTRTPGLHLLRAAFQFGATALFFTSLNFIGLAEATALTDINPVLITHGAAIFLGEKLGPRRIAGVLVAMIGALIVIRPGLAVFTPAALLPLAGAVCYAGNALLTRHIGQRESLWTSMIYASLFGTLAAGVFMPHVWTAVQIEDLPLFLLVGSLGTVAQLCIIRSFSITEASVVAPFAYVGIILATGWGMALYGEYPDRWTILGALVIAGAGLYVWHRETRAARGQ